MKSTDLCFFRQKVILLEIDFLLKLALIFQEALLTEFSAEEISPVYLYLERNNVCCCSQNVNTEKLTQSPSCSVFLLN